MIEYKSLRLQQQALLEEGRNVRNENEAAIGTTFINEQNWLLIKNYQLVNGNELQFIGFYF